MIAVLVVVVLFVKVLERFGLLAAGYDGKERKKKKSPFMLGGGACLISSCLDSHRPLVA